MSDTTTRVPSTPSSPLPAAAADERLAYRGVFQRLLVRPEIGAGIGAVVVWVLFWAVSVPFGKTSGAASILDVASSPLGIMAVAVAMLMIGGEFDLSSGAATGALGILTILLVRDVAGEIAGAGLSLWVALPVSLAAALGLGWFNGTLVNRTSLPSFIVTLASFFILKGAKLGYSKLIVDQIQVGKLNDLEIYADETGGSDKGYRLLDQVFAGEWVRNDHIWGSRDIVYTIGILSGLSLIALAVYELHFRRSEKLNPAGLVAFLVGVAVAIGGVLLLHSTDGVGGNWTGALVIGAGMLVGFLGWALWRYDRQTGTSFAITSRAGVLAGAGVAAAALAVAVSRWLDANNGTDTADAFSLSGGRILLYSLIFGGVVASVTAQRNGFASLRLGRSGLVPLLTMGFIGFSTAMLFFLQSTEQGARAILFIVFASAAAVLMLMAVSAARRESAGGGSAILLLTAVVVALMAFFIRNESVTPKFRVQAFSIMLAIAAVMAIWALANVIFQKRQELNPGADRTGRILTLVGLTAVVIGVISRLLWITQAEIDSGISQTKFSVRILWFVAVTALATWVLGRTKFGSWTFAVGGNKQASRQIGVPADRTKIQLFMIVSAAAWLVGILLAFRLNTIQASTGDGEEFEYIIAAVVGGTALTGGYGSTLGAAIGALIMAMSIQGIPSARWNSDWRFVFVGVILLLAVIGNNFIRTKAEASR